MAEIESSVLSRQCLDRRSASVAEWRGQVAAWAEQRNREGARVEWRFTTADARTKRRHLYPQF